MCQNAQKNNTHDIDMFFYEYNFDNTQSYNVTDGITARSCCQRINTKDRYNELQNIEHDYNLFYEDYDVYHCHYGSSDNLLTSAYCCFVTWVDIAPF